MMAQAQENEAAIGAITSANARNQAVTWPQRDTNPTILQRVLSIASGFLDRVRQRGNDSSLARPLSVTDDSVNQVPTREFTLPVQAETLSHLYADELEIQSLQNPLEQFLIDAAKAPRLQAILLAVRDESHLPPILSIYALTNLTQAYHEGYANPSAPGSVRTAYKAFLSRVEGSNMVGIADTFDLADIPIRTNLSFLNTGGQDVSSILPTLKQKLVSEEFMGTRTATGTLRTIDIAIPQKIDVGAVG